MTTRTSTNLERAARQVLETEQLFGPGLLPRFIRPQSLNRGTPPTPTAVSTRSSDPTSAVPINVMEPAAPLASLADIEARFRAAFPICQSLSEATQPVFGEGDGGADLMFVGEAPGADEDRLGRPFVGAAGRKLDEIIKAMSFQREQVYIANILKARPPANRTPLPDEVAAHSPYLVEQIRSIQPRVIVALGRPAAHFLLDTNFAISRLRGVWGTWRHHELTVAIMPTFHPAYLLRQYTDEVRGQVWHDMQMVMSRLATHPEGQ